MNKDTLINIITQQTSFTKAQADSALKTIFSILGDALINQEKILIPGFGSFSTKVRPERTGRNPTTGKKLLIPETVVVTFKPASQLKQAVSTKGKIFKESASSPELLAKNKKETSTLPA